MLTLEISKPQFLSVWQVMEIGIENKCFALPFELASYFKAVAGNNKWHVN